MHVRVLIKQVHFKFHIQQQIKVSEYGLRKWAESLWYRSLTRTHTAEIILKDIFFLQYPIIMWKAHTLADVTLFNELFCQIQVLFFLWHLCTNSCFLIVISGYKAALSQRNKANYSVTSNVRVRRRTLLRTPAFQTYILFLSLCSSVALIIYLGFFPISAGFWSVIMLPESSSPNWSLLIA